ncbi:MAG: chromate transporter [bacterium]|nr:chromate transporter [bacterium]
MIYLLLAIEFFKIGIFSFGGGYATIPFLYHIADTMGWYTSHELTQMIAVASITPGPVGLNIATYAGIKTAGIMGAALATASEVLPSLILVIVASKILKKYSNSKYTKAVITTLKPVCCGLLSAVFIKLAIISINSLANTILLIILILLSIRLKKSPLFYITLSAIFGIITVLL